MPGRRRAAAAWAALAIGLTFAGANSAAAQDAAGFFRQNCVSCHTIGGGRLTGPDLKNVEGRKDRAWLERFVLDPQAVINSGDPYALQLKEEARGVVMPKVQGIAPDVAKALMDLIAAESKLERSQFAGLQISDEPFTAQQIALGKAIFRGDKPLEGMGPACVACHTVKGAAALGGGRLGPDLSRAYERLNGRKGLAAWLVAPATTTMQSLFKGKAMKPEEILAITAYLEDSAKKGGEDPMTGVMVFFLIGLGGAFLGLMFFDSIWKYRFQAVRTPLVHGDSPRGGKR